LHRQGSGNSCLVLPDGTTPDDLDNVVSVRAASPEQRILLVKSLERVSMPARGETESATEADPAETGRGAPEHGRLTRDSALPPPAPGAILFWKWEEERAPVISQGRMQAVLALQLDNRADPLRVRVGLLIRSKVPGVPGLWFEGRLSALPRKAARGPGRPPKANHTVSFDEPAGLPPDMKIELKPHMYDIVVFNLRV